jgi:hypothetical protein
MIPQICLQSRDAFYFRLRRSGAGDSYSTRAPRQSRIHDARAGAAGAPPDAAPGRLASISRGDGRGAKDALAKLE